MKRMILVGLILGMFFGVKVEATDLYVPSPHGITIQSTINAATTGDTVWVADGTYAGAGNKNLSWSGKYITVRSASGAENCIIDCQNNGRGFYFSETGQNSSDVIDGFTIRNGYAAGGIPGWPNSGGGGIHCNSSSPTILNCIITGSAAWDGGGIFCNSSSSLILNCIITGNTATYGGGIHCRNFSPTITNNIISGNSGYGIYEWDINSDPPTNYNCFCNNAPGDYYDEG